jgi:hypothetical protein
MEGKTVKRGLGRLKKTTDPLENLLPPDIIQPRVQIPHARRQVLNLLLVAALERTGLANGKV